MSFLKKSELIFKHIIYFFLGIFFHNRPVQIPIQSSGIKKILLLRYDRLGDMVISIPYIRALRKALPDCIIDIVASDRNKIPLEYEKSLNTVYIFKSGFLNFLHLTSRLRKENYDLIFCLVSSKTTNAGLFANFAGTRKSIKIIQGYEKRNKLYSVLFNVLTDQARDEMRMTDMMLEQASMVIGTELKKFERNKALELNEEILNKAEQYIEEKNTGKFIFMNISAGTAIKCLSTQKNREIAEYILEKSTYSVILCYSSEDRQKAMEISALSERIFSFEPAADLLASAIIFKSEFVLSPDTAIIHIAASFDKKGIAYYTPANGPMNEWLPLSDSISVLTVPEKSLAEDIDIKLIKEELGKFFGANE